MIVATAVFINLLQPFGLNNWNETHKWLVISGYVMIYAGLYRLIYLIGSQLFPDYYSPHSWTRLKELRVLVVYVPVVTIAGWVFVEYAIEEMVWSFKTFFGIQYYNCLLGAFMLPVLKYIVFPNIKKKYHLLVAHAPNNTALPIQEPGMEDYSTVKEKQMAVAERINEKNNVQLAESETNPEDYITVNKKCIAVNKIIFVMSDRNYVHVWFLNKGRMIEIIERCPMKEFKTRINAFPQFLHCYESFLVNLNDIASWSMTTDDKMNIQLKSSDEIIPVSRNKQAFMKEILNNHYILKK
jgi:hypothetical protein